LDPAPSLLAELAKDGILGVLLALALVWLWLKDRELKRESAARIRDAQNYGELALKLQERAISVAEKLAEGFEEMRRLYPPPGGRR
jgi:hypothetical protein